MGVYLDPGKYTLHLTLSYLVMFLVYLHRSPKVFKTDPLEPSSQIGLTKIKYPKAF